MVALAEALALPLPVVDVLVDTLVPSLEDVAVDEDDAELRVGQRRSGGAWCEAVARGLRR